jgi:thymidylate synthase
MKSRDVIDRSESPTTTENVVLSEAKSPTVHEETQYLNLIREIIDTGSYETSRNGNTYTKFGYNMRFSLKDGRIPLITTKKMVVKACFEELFWFIRGSTSSTELQERGVNIWNRNGTREFLDSRGLYHLDEGDLGPIYGHQWRHFNAEYTNSSACYKGSGIDQLKYVIDELSDPQTRSSRRIIMTAWNPCQINQMALPPCHIMAQFHVRDNKYLSCALFQRSGDVGLGIPFNIASYALLTHILAKHCGLEAEEFVHFLGNCHIYEEHVDALKKQMVLEPKEFPQISINKRDEIEDYGIDDIVWMTPYQSHPSIKMDMKA